MYSKGKLTRDFSQNTKKILTGTWNLSQKFPVIGLVANKVLLYRIKPDGTRWYIYIPSEELERAAHTMNGKKINWNHEEGSRELGTAQNCFYEDNQLKGELDVTDPDYIRWVEEQKKQNLVPNVSPEFENETRSIIDVEDGFIELCYDLNFLGIALTPRGVCKPSDGCGIPLKEFTEENMELADSFWLNHCNLLMKEMGYNLNIEIFDESGICVDPCTFKEFAEWDTAYVNDLPDSAFALVLSGGKKDEEGKTVPRSLRKLPYKDASGKVDLPHLRNALARAPQMSVSADLKEKAIALLRRVAAKFLPTYKKEETKEGSNEEDKKMTEECGEKKELSEQQIAAVVDEKLKPVLEAQEKLMSFLSKFEPPKKEEKPKELSVEEQVRKAMAEQLAENMERQELLKKFANIGIKGIETLSLEALKKLEIEPEAHVPNATRKTMFTNDEGKTKEFKDLSEAEKDALSYIAVRQQRGIPVDTVKVMSYIDENPKKNLYDLGWWRPPITEPQGVNT